MWAIRCNDNHRDSAFTTICDQCQEGELAACAQDVGRSNIATADIPDVTFAAKARNQQPKGTDPAR